MGTSVSQIQCFRVCFACRRRFFNLLKKVLIKVLNASRSVTSAIFPLKKKNWLFFDVSAGCLNYWRDPKINPRWYWRCLLYWQVMFKSKVCSCAYMEREWWRLLRMSATQNVLPCFEIPCKDQKLTFILFGTDGSYCFVKNTSRYYENEKPSFFFNNFLRQSQSATPEPLRKKAKKLFHQWHNRVDSSLVDTVNQKFISFLFLYIFCL